MKKDREALIAVIFNGIAEVCAIVVFGGLAYHFKHWWIALFSLLYSFSYETKAVTKKEGDENVQ